MEVRSERGEALKGSPVLYHTELGTRTMTPEEILAPVIITTEDRPNDSGGGYLQDTGGSSECIHSPECLDGSLVNS